MKRPVITGNVSMASKYGSEIIQLILCNEMPYCLRVFVDSDSGSNKISEIKHTEIRDQFQYVTRIQLLVSSYPRGNIMVHSIFFRLFPFEYLNTHKVLGNKPF